MTSVVSMQYLLISPLQPHCSGHRKLHKRIGEIRLGEGFSSIGFQDLWITDEPPFSRLFGCINYPRYKRFRGGIIVPEKQILEREI
jgi:hypothetical protein